MRTKTTTMIVVGLVFLTAGTNLWAATITVTSASGGTGGPDCTVRDAITAANTDTATGGCPAGSGADVIELPAGVTITLTEVDNSTDGFNGLPSLSSEMTINGNGATVERSSAPGTGRFRIFRIQYSGTLLLDNLTVTGGLPSDCDFNPFFCDLGGGIYNVGMLELTHCTVSGNEASTGGGIFSQGTLTLTHSTVSGNEANKGGGIYNFQFGSSTLTNSTVSGNTAGSDGGGVYHETGLLSLTHTTVSGNSANGFGGGILIFEGQVTLTNSIVADSCVAWEGSVVTDNGFNIVEDGNCGFPAAGDPNLGPLADNGGPTRTHALLPGSIAIDAITDPEACTVTTDQRGVSRPHGPFCDIGAFEFEIETECPAGPYNVADGDAEGLIFAIECANALLGPDTINLAANGTYTLTAVGNNTEGPNGLPPITSEITVNGNGATIARSDADGTPEFRIFYIFGPGNLLLNNLTLTGGVAAGRFPEFRGGGIFNSGGTLTLTDSTVSGNSAVYRGGGIYNGAGSVATLTNSTVSGNSVGTGGGIFNWGTLTLTNSTVSGNSATHPSGIGGGGIYNQGGILTLANSIVGNSPSGGDYRNDWGLVNDQGFNIVEDGSGISCGNPSNHCTDPNLGPLADNGGPTLTHALLSGSIAIDAIIVPGACTVTTDQRGVPRPLGPFCDIGSFETTEACSDTDTDTDGDGVPDDCDNCSLFNPDQADCQDNGVGDVCDLADGTSPDCNGNNVPDECDVSPFPEHLSENTTGIPDAIYIGPPDDTFWGIGGQIVTYDFGDLLVFDGTGPDFNVYEVDFGGPEFDIIDVLVSEDGITFVSVVASGGPSVPIAGDDRHSNDDFARSYDIASSGLSAVRLIRIDGDGTGPAGGTTGFDLDAIGIIHPSADCNGNGVPDECESDTDTDGDGVPDICDNCNLFNPDQADCQDNGVGDVCDLADGTSSDCNDNDTPDECDIAQYSSADCNGNGIPDECITLENDCNSNGLVDECEHIITEQVISTAADGAASVFAADLDGDGDNDVLSASSSDAKIAWYENTDGAGAFGGQQVISTAANGATSVFAADLDGDGDLDVLSASWADDKIAWYENTDGLGSFGPQQIISTEANQARSVFAADLDGDGDTDVLSASRYDDKIAWYENLDGLGTFGEPQVISNAANGAFSVFAADLDGDGDNDVLSASRIDDKIAWYENTDGAGSFGPQQIISTAANGAQAVFAADLDGDGDLDVLSASWSDDLIAWYENTDGLGSFGPQQVISTEANQAVFVFAADLDGDGDIDVLSASPNDDKIAWYENTDGAGSFGEQQVISTAADNAQSVFAADLDGDGDTDVLSASLNDDKIAWYRLPESTDCNGNDIPDECDIAEGNNDDCNGNDIPDECDIADGSSHDDDQNGIPDECRCPADFDGDGVVNAADLAQLLGSWGPYEPCPPFGPADFNEDCGVNAADLAQLLGSWGPCE